jgi:hypothetical protein
MSTELLTFNGINAADGRYLTPPMTVQDLGRIAFGYEWRSGHLAELKWRYSPAGATYALRSDLNPLDLKDAGWGIIFPAGAEPDQVEAIREALGELLERRKEQAGPRYKEFYRGDKRGDESDGFGYKQGKSKDEFLVAHDAGPGPVDPLYVPYYLLIVGDPQSIPFTFQYELDVQYAVGRIYFDDLDQYAQYARSVVEAETSGKVSLPRKAVFFGVENEGDLSTQLSAIQLAEPLAEYVISQTERLGWQAQLVPPEETTKDRLSQLLGGEETPAFLFTASHGVGFPYGHKNQFPFQGALLCRDWPGPDGTPPGGIPRAWYLGGEDIADDADLLGLIAFHFACYGAGTPHQDSYAKRALGLRSTLAPHAFLADLPKRLLSHPKGGALAVVGHVDRAWSYSFDWKGAASSTTTFESILFKLLNGGTLGHALDDMNLRYAEFATLLSSELEDGWDPDLSHLARLWTAHNDARGYAIIGDPAVRLPVAKKGATAAERPAIEALPGGRGELPPVLVAQALAKEPADVPAGQEPALAPPPGPTVYAQPQTVLDGYAAMMSRYGELDAQDYAFGKKEIQQVMASLSEALQSLTSKLADVAADVSGVEVATYVGDDMENIKFKKGRFSAPAEQRALTHINLGGDTHVCVPLDAGDLDEALRAIHSDMVQQAMANRTALIKAVTDALTGLLSPG